VTRLIRDIRNCIICKCNFISLSSTEKFPSHCPPIVSYSLPSVKPCSPHSPSIFSSLSLCLLLLASVTPYASPCYVHVKLPPPSPISILARTEYFEGLTLRKPDHEKWYCDTEVTRSLASSWLRLLELFRTRGARQALCRFVSGNQSNTTRYWKRKIRGEQLSVRKETILNIKMWYYM